MLDGKVGHRIHQSKCSNGMMLMYESVFNRQIEEKTRQIHEDLLSLL